MSPVRRREKIKSRSPLLKAANKRKTAHRLRYRRSSSSRSRLSSTSPVRRKNLKQVASNVSALFLIRVKLELIVLIPGRTLQDVLSSSDCSDSNCSMCKFEKSTKEKKKKTKAEREKIAKRASPPREPRLKPRVALPRLPPTSSSRYARYVKCLYNGCEVLETQFAGIDSPDGLKEAL